ncbi:Hsp33 family molecular chaperone HslO [Pelosinus propionicus]|uniref:33 kDa chaperonin n=1 Tax=Pelosinus propionicus DSM 13327 TaxID=1123291 RepID=A0A1I4L9Q8_9FIRM|nr:Hsp33 family molecular chaperone HslO [Pelosinus propionicus]SFL87533.1 molecular chaperone Hsp33 [Pelosinus propionicus DSM 13327]
MGDHITRGTIVGGVRAFAAVTTTLAEEARKRHDCYPVAAAALGRTMTGALLLAANLKTDESITIKISGDGPLGEVVTDAHVNGSVRGYVKNPHTHLPLREGKLDVGHAIGKGQISVTRFTGLKQPFTGSAELVSGEIAEDITNYLYISEQTPSTIALGVLVQPDMTVTAAGGFMVQALPNADDEVLSKIEKNITLLPPVSQLINEGLDAAGIINRIFTGLSATIYEEVPLEFKCTCSLEKVQKVLVSLGAEEINDILVEDGEAEVCCPFCSAKYQFNKSNLEEIIDIIEKQ